MTDDVGICNLAMQRLGARAITALDQDIVEARECNRVFEHARDSELRDHPWSFARVRVELAALSTDPIFGYAKQYQLPADYLRMLTETDQLDWQIEGRSILTDDGSPIQLVYLKRVTDPNEFDALYTDLLVSRIAMDTAEKITQSNSKIQIAAERYTDVKKIAKKVNAFERPSQQPPTDPWILARL